MADHCNLIINTFNEVSWASLSHQHHHDCRHHHDDYAEEAPSMRLAVETLEELDWCLDQLESLQVNLTVIIMMKKASTRMKMTMRRRRFGRQA